METTTPSRVRVSCRRCGGLGNIPAYRPLNGGDCWDCGGVGTEVVTVGSAPHMSSEALKRMDDEMEFDHKVGRRIEDALIAAGVGGEYGGEGVVYVGRQTRTSCPLEKVIITREGIRFRGRLLPKGLTYTEIAARLAG